MQLKKTAKRGTYSALITTEHGQRRINTGCTNIDDAKEVVKKSGIREIELLAKSVRITGDVVNQIVVGRRLKFSEAVTMWLDWQRETNLSPRTIEVRECMMNAWMRDHSLADTPLSMVTEKHVSKWVNDPASTTKRSTRVIMLSAASSLFGYCSAKGIITGNPAKLVRVNMDLMSHEQKEVKEVSIFSDQEMDTLVGYFKREIADLRKRIAQMTSPVKGAVEKVEEKIDWLQWWVNATMIARYTGLRLSDVVGLEWSCVKPGRITVWTSKTDTRVDVPYYPEEVLKDIGDDVAPDRIPIIKAEYTAARVTLDFVFKNVKRADPKFCFPIQVESFKACRAGMSTQFIRHCNAAGLSGKSFHSLRHTYASISKSLGIPIPHISESMGHAGEEMTRTYIHRWPKAPSI